MALNISIDLKQKNNKEVPEQVTTEDHAQHEDEEAYPKNDVINIECKMTTDVCGHYAELVCSQYVFITQASCKSTNKAVQVWV